MLSTAQILEILQTIPAGYKCASDDYFKSANATLFIPPYKKLGVITNAAADEALLDSSQETAHNSSDNTEMYCNVPSCRRYFESISAYQTHFNSVHRYICAQCKKSLPTPHLLDLHISEQHDSYFAARLARGEPMYECFLEECKEQRWQTPAQRKEHCIAVHKFPGNFRFDQVAVKSGAGKQRKSTSAVDAMEQEEVEIATHKIVEKIIKPKNYSFGHPKSKTFNAKSQNKVGRTKQTEGSTLESMQSLKQALDGM